MCSYGKPAGQMGSVLAWKVRGGAFKSFFFFVFFFFLKKKDVQCAE